MNTDGYQGRDMNCGNAKWPAGKNYAYLWVTSVDSRVNVRISSGSGPISTSIIGGPDQTTHSYPKKGDYIQVVVSGINGNGTLKGVLRFH